MGKHHKSKKCSSKEVEKITNNFNNDFKITCSSKGDNDCSCDTKKCCTPVTQNISQQPGIFSVNFHSPTTDGYWLDSTFSPMSIFGPNNTNIPSPLPTWCTEINVTINTSTLYNTIPISAYDPILVSILAFYGVTINQYNIRKIIYILNNLNKYKNLVGYSYVDTQTAIWQLLDYPTAVDPNIPPPNANNLAYILADANQFGANYIPCSPTDYNGIFMISLSLAGPLAGQPIVPPPNSPPIPTNAYQMMICPIQLQNLVGSPFFVDCDCKC